MSSYDLGNYLRELIRERGMSVTDLSRRTSLSRECLYKLMRGDVQQPDLTTIIRLSKALHTHPVLLLRRLFDGWEFRQTAALSGNGDGDSVGFIGDTTYPDNSLVCVNETFTKVWEIQNTGRRMWRNRRLICMDEHLELHVENSGECPEFQPPSRKRCLDPKRREVEIPDVCPGESVRLSVEFTAPPFPCATISYWKMVDESGVFCFPDNEGLSCMVQVVAL